MTIDYIESNMELIRAYNQGATDACYSRGIGACPYPLASELSKAWQIGYNESYKHG